LVMSGGFGEVMRGGLGQVRGKFGWVRVGSGDWSARGAETGLRLRLEAETGLRL